MWDAIMLAVAVAFFALAITYASGLDRLWGGAMRAKSV
jgi:hypothetical protein